MKASDVDGGHSTMSALRPFLETIYPGKITWSHKEHFLGLSRASLVKELPSLVEDVSSVKMCQVFFLAMTIGQYGTEINKKETIKGRSTSDITA